MRKYIPLLLLLASCTKEAPVQTPSQKPEEEITFDDFSEQVAYSFSDDLSQEERETIKESVDLAQSRFPGRLSRWEIRFEHPIEQKTILETKIDGHKAKIITAPHACQKEVYLYTLGSLIMTDIDHAALYNDFTEISEGVHKNLRNHLVPGEDNLETIIGYYDRLLEHGVVLQGARPFRAKGCVSLQAHKGILQLLGVLSFVSSWSNCTNACKSLESYQGSSMEEYKLLLKSLPVNVVGWDEIKDVENHKRLLLESFEGSIRNLEVKIPRAGENIRKCLNVCDNYDPETDVLETFAYLVLDKRDADQDELVQLKKERLGKSLYRK